MRARTSPDSAPSAPVTPPGVAIPAAPTNVTAIPGDTQAAVSFTVSPPPTGAPITSYAVTSNPGGIVVSIPPPASGNTATALVGGLTNGVSYTFTVQAVDSAASAASAPSNAVTPSAANVPVLTVAISGPTSVSTTPSQVTYTITVTNPITPTSAFPANVSVTHTLTPVPATIVAGGASRNAATGIVTITTASPHALNIGQTITIAGLIFHQRHLHHPGRSNCHHADICSGRSCRYQRFRNCYWLAARQHCAGADQSGHVHCWWRKRDNRYLQPGISACGSLVNHDGDRADPEPSYPQLGCGQRNGCGRHGDTKCQCQHYDHRAFADGFQHIRCGLRDSEIRRTRTPMSDRLETSPGSLATFQPR